MPACSLLGIPTLEEARCSAERLEWPKAHFSPVKTRILLSFALLVVLATLACWRWARPAPLGEADFLLIREVANHSGNADFDDSLREALRVLLLQSPYLNLVSDENIRATLTGLGKPGESPLAPELSQEICERAGANAYLTGNAYSSVENRQFGDAATGSPTV
jgi:hypothetical protein